MDESDIIAFAVQESGEKDANCIEGPAQLGDYTVWRCWTSDGDEFHAHYVVAKKGRVELEFKRDFAPFANWLLHAFDAADVHGRRLDWLRSIIASVITLALVAILLWAVGTGQAKGIDYGWLIGALAAAGLGYLLGKWVRRPAP